jgi:RNA polymerase sigma-70 factor, ECF subfamily
VDANNDSQAEIELIRRIGNGDRASFEEFYDRYAGLIYSTALRVLNDVADAEEVAQEVLFMIWEKAPMYDASRGKPLTWAVTMTRNKAIDRIRTVQRRIRLRDRASAELDPDAFIHDRRPFDDADSHEQGRLVRSAVLQLKAEQRQVIEMAYFGGLTQQEIADQLHEPLGTIKARIRRGMMRLRKLIAPDDHPSAPL